jgi:cytoskeletal protein CcmA (bactofilin family)
VSIIARDLRVEGTLTSSSVIRVEGTVVGIIRAERQVLVARGGIVTEKSTARLRPMVAWRCRRQR